MDATIDTKEVRTWKRYDDIKASTSRWLGPTPSHWHVTSFKRATSRVVVGIAEAATHAYAEQGVPIIRSTNVRANRLRDDDLLYVQPWFAQENQSKYLRSGDLVTVRTGYPGTTAVVPQKLHMCQCFTLLISTLHAEHVPEYFSYVLNSAPSRAYFEVEGWGSAQQNISVPILQFLPVPIPPPKEQKAIAHFLDRETARIDGLIGHKERLIELLEEKRRAVISHAVTRGLDSNAKMKDSGVEWLGVVPSHWELKRLKFAATFQRGHDLPVDNRKDGIVPLVTSAGATDTHSESAAIAPGIVTGRYGTIGNFYLIETDYWPLNTTLYTNNLHNNYVKFLHYMLHILEPLFHLYAEKSAVPGIDRNDIHQLKVAVPPTSQEQRDIADYLNVESKRIIEVIQQIRFGIEQLQEYRTALISAAVTGQIDVREEVPAND